MESSGFPSVSADRAFVVTINSLLALSYVFALLVARRSDWKVHPHPRIDSFCCLATGLAGAVVTWLTAGSLL